MTASARFRRLVCLAAGELDACMQRGETPDVDRLAGAEFRGANTATWTVRLRMQQFVKGFERRPDGTLFGYNRRVAQDWRWCSPGERFAFFAVRSPGAGSQESRYPGALLLDYGAGGNPRFDPSRPIRDHLVRVDPGTDELLLGRAFLALGPLHPSPTFFVLERRPTTFRPGSHPG